FGRQIPKGPPKQSGRTIKAANSTSVANFVGTRLTGDRNLKAIVGGEAVSAELARKLAACCGSVWNMYGPTETTVWSSLYRVDGREERTVPIGQPIGHTTLYVLGPHREPLDTGSEGELYIGGQALA